MFLYLLYFAISYRINVESKLDKQVCLSINIDEVDLSPAIVKISGGIYKDIYRVLDNEKYKVGDVLFGNFTYTGDCDYKFRIITKISKPDKPTTVNIWTMTNKTKNDIKSFIETETGSNEYIPIIRTPIPVDLNQRSLEPELVIIRNDENDVDEIKINSVLEYTKRIGPIKLGNVVIEDCENCTERVILIWMLDDITRMVTVNSSKENDEIESETYKETGLKTHIFEKFEGLVPCFVSPYGCNNEVDSDNTNGTNNIIPN